MHGLTPAPPPGSAEEVQAFERLQAQFAEQFRTIYPDRQAPKTVLVLPSLSLDPDVLARISGSHHYEERMLCLLLLLRMPRTRVIYVTSTPIAESIIDYYLHLMPGIPARHARSRLTLLSCHDSRPIPLTAKLLNRPRMLTRIQRAIPDREGAHVTCFNVTALERTLSVRLGVPVFGCDPRLLPLGSKSGSRRLFREADVSIPDGFEDLYDGQAVADALAELKVRNPELRRAVVKLNEGFSGEGNAIYRYTGHPPVPDDMPDLAFESTDMTWDIFQTKLADMGGIVEAFIEGEDKRSPSAQYRVDPLGGLDLISTHDQVLGGESSQIFLGCRFPADGAYRREIQREGYKAARLLAQQGVQGRFGVDFISVREDGRWRHYAIEVNLRKGGTTHPFLTLQFLTDGSFDPDSGLYHTPTGQPCFYYASDNLESPHYRGLTPDDLIDIAVMNGLHFNSAAQQGVVFHLIGALSEFGKLGVVCVADTHTRALGLYEETVAILDREGGAG